MGSRNRCLGFIELARRGKRPADSPSSGKSINKASVRSRAEPVFVKKIKVEEKVRPTLPQLHLPATELSKQQQATPLEAEDRMQQSDADKVEKNESTTGNLVTSLKSRLLQPVATRPFNPRDDQLESPDSDCKPSKQSGKPNVSVRDDQWNLSVMGPIDDDSPGDDGEVHEQRSPMRSMTHQEKLKLVSQKNKTANADQWLISDSLQRSQARLV